MRRWIQRNKGRNKAEPKQTILYSGREDDLNVLDDLPQEDLAPFERTPIRISIEQHCKLHLGQRVPFNHLRLEQVLKSLSDHA